MFAYIRKEEERAYIDKLKPFCKKIQVFKRGKVWSLKNVLGSQFSFNPLLVTMYRSKELQQAISEELATGQYQLLHVETFYMMPNIPETNLPKILVVQTIEHLGYKDFTKKLSNPFLKPFYYWDVQKIKHWEEYYWRRANRLIAMSAEDRSYILRRVPNIGDISVVANGVDTDFFDEVPKQLTKRFTVFFVGTFKWLPNVEAVTYLVEKVWDKIKAKIPNARLLIVGNSPSNKILSYAKEDPSIEVKENITDIRDAYKQANVLLAPVWSGKGTRYKILEAMATKTPIVATDLAVEGIGIEHRKHALVGNTPEELANATIEISKNPTLAKELAANGKKLVGNNYNWQAISTQLDEIYQSVGKK